MIAVVVSGYVGQGMLSCAVAGSVFTSPPPQAILTGLRTIAKDNSGTIVVLPSVRYVDKQVRKITFIALC